MSLAVVFAMFGVMFGILPSAYSQTTEISEQITLSNDLLNSPLAQEILQKIAESKRKIEKLEQQNYDNLQAQKFLEDRRAVALERLNQSLILWEEKWYKFSPKVAYQKFIDKMPSDVHGVYAKQFEFTEFKHDAGINAKTKVLANGGSSEHGTQEFRKAAKSTLRELSDYNERIQPNYAESLKKQLSERIAYWNDLIDNRDEKIEKYRTAIERDYSLQLSIVTKNERADSRQVIEYYTEGTITQKSLSHKLDDINEKYLPDKEKILDAKADALSELEIKYDNWMPDTIDKLISSRHQIDSHIEIIWNSDTERYDVVSTSGFLPNQPVITRLVTSPTEIQLFWESPEGIDDILVTGYKIEVKSNNQPYAILVDNTGNRNTSYTHTDLITGEFYTYRISAISDEISTPSNEIRISTAIS